MASSKIKVALVSFDFGEYSVRLSNGLAPDTNVLLFLPEIEAQRYAHMLDKSVKLRTFRKPRLRQPVQQMRVMAGILRQIRDFQPDLIHLQAGHLWFNLSLPLLRQFPLVVTVHDPTRHVGDSETRKTPGWVFDRACYQARERIVHVPQMKQLLLEKLGIPAHTVHIVPHILVGDDTAGSNVQEDESLILFFGRIWAYKGLEYLIRAEPSISSQVPNAKIAIAGRGEDFDRYRQMMGNPDRFVVYNDYISDEKRAELFKQASVIVLPYIEASQSGVIPLAYRYGKPVVATTVGGLPAQVEDGKTGYLVEPRDEKALADAIVRLLQNPGLRRQFGETGRSKLDVECAPDLVARKTRNVYLRAINRNLAPILQSRQSGSVTRLDRSALDTVEPAAFAEKVREELTI